MHVTSSLDSFSTQLALALMLGNVFLDQISLPLPAIPTPLIAGVVAVDHHWWGLEILLGATATFVATDVASYVAGRRYGDGVMKLLCRISLTPDSCVSDRRRQFERWGPNAILIAKSVPGLAVIAPPLAGALGMRWPRFLGLTALAGSLWAGTYIGLGALLRPHVDWLLPRLSL